MNLTTCKYLPLKALLFMLLVSITLVQSQIISPASMKNMDVNKLSNGEVLNIRNEMKAKSIDFPALENMAVTNGMSASDFTILKTRIESLDPEPVNSNVEKGNDLPEKVVQFDDNAIKRSQIYGSEIFTNSSLSFEPNSSMATPSNYVLGAGDELQIVVFGMQETSGAYSVNKEGRINVPIVGQIFVNGLTFEAAKVQIKKAFSKVYRSIGSGQSDISMSLSKIRTIKVTIIGVKKPGNYSVSSLSTIFNALHIAGGPNDNGSYRKIELIRNNEVIKTVDLYKFLTKGDQSDNLNLLENDLIRVPVYENRVKIGGNVKKEGIFEMLESETIKDLMIYCGGFDEAAYRKNIKVLQNSSDGLKVLDLKEDEFFKYKLNIGDVIKVGPLLNKLENKITIRGSVFRPDSYEFIEGLTLKQLIEKADGFTNDVFKDRALLIREKSDLTKEIVNLNLTSESDLATIMRKNDEIVISSIFDFKDVENVSITGFVKNAGIFPYIENLTLYDLIIQAGGFKQGASRHFEISRPIIKDGYDKDSKVKSNLIIGDLDTMLIDATKNIFLKPYDVVSIRKKPTFDMQKKVTVFGEVIYPGNYTLSSSDETVLDLLNRSGGLKSEANIEAIYIIRNGKKIPINYKKIEKSPKSRQNIPLKVDDDLYVRKIDNTVNVLGNVYLNTEVPFIKAKRSKYYIRSVGGLNENSDKKRIRVIYANGLGKTTRNFGVFRIYPKITAGADIIVPVKVERIKSNKFTTAELSIIGAAIATISTSIIAIISLVK